ncbi:MAG: hypothetical protein ACPIOQ_80860 [Promethearchaeia archaeon]
MPSVIPTHYGNPFVGAVRRPGSCVASAMTSHLRTPSVSSVRRRSALVEIFAGVVRPELAVCTAASHEKASSPTAVVREPSFMLSEFFFFSIGLGRQGRRPSPPAWRRQQVPPGRACCGWQDDALYYSCRALPRQAGALVENCCPEGPSAAHKQAGQTQEGAMKANGHTT